MVPNKIIKKFILGTAQLGDKYGINNPNASKSKKNSLKILKFAKNFGINAIDLADKYKSYQSIFKIFKLKEWKVSMKISSNIINKSYSKNKFENIFFKTLSHLGKKKIEYFFFHNSSDLNSKNGKKVFSYLIDLKKKGLIKKIGISIYAPNELYNLLKNFRFDVIQLPLNIFDRRFCQDKIVKKLQRNKIEVHVRSIFLQGLLLSNKKILKKKYFRNNYSLDAWFNYVKENKKNAVAECLNFVLKKKFVNKIVIGVNKLEHLKLIIKKINSKINIEDLDKFQNHDINLIDPRRWKKIK